MPKIHIHPALPDGPDPGNGGIGRVIAGQLAELPAYGWEIVDDPAQADLIACHIEIPDQYLRLWPHKPFVVHNHGNYWAPDYNWLVPWPYASNKRALESMRAADAITAVSEWTANALRRHTNRDVRVVLHGVDLDEWPLQQ
ncbi:MAG TPA: glycosyltransferase family 4 protein, partial [Phycisphaerae bacterium]|nr:glycosyltransferase family 4 protein [Phycisphaerae bacterium]